MNALNSRSVFCLVLMFIFLSASTAAAPDPLCESLIGDKKNVLVVAAHPDDIETIAGGTVGLLTTVCGVKVSYLLTTNGDKGWNKNYDMTSPVLAQIREVEQINAGVVLGVKNISFMRNPDAGLEGLDQLQLKKNITSLIREYKPDLILTFSPETDYSTFQFGNTFFLN